MKACAISCPCSRLLRAGAAASTVFLRQSIEDHPVISRLSQSSAGNSRRRPQRGGRGASPTSTASRRRRAAILQRHVSARARRGGIPRRASDSGAGTFGPRRSGRRDRAVPGFRPRRYPLVRIRGALAGAAASAVLSRRYFGVNSMSYLELGEWLKGRSLRIQGFGTAHESAAGALVLEPMACDFTPDRSPTRSEA
jgi:hypothetical protein